MMRASDYPRVCANCKWWVPNRDDGDSYSDDGTCHRYPPKFEYDPGSYYFPETDDDMWCGEFAIMRHPRIAAAPSAEFANAPTLALGA